MLAARYMEMFDIEKHIDKIKETYRHRCELMLNCIKEEFPKGVKHTSPEGGLFIWVELPANIAAKEVFKKALENNVAFVPGDSFFPKGDCKNTLRLNFSNMPEEKIIEGIKRLGSVLKSMIEM
jgi:2-aminoadipate transaminase